ELAEEEPPERAGHGDRVDEHLPPERPADVRRGPRGEGARQELSHRDEPLVEGAVQPADDELAARRELDVPRRVPRGPEADHAADGALPADELRDRLFVEAVLQRDGIARRSE